MKTRFNILLIKIAIRHQNWFAAEDALPTAHETLTTWLADDEIRQYIQVNIHKGEEWFQQEAFETFLQTMEAVALAAIEIDSALTAKEHKTRTAACQKLIGRLDEAKMDSSAPDHPARPHPTWKYDRDIPWEVEARAWEALDPA